MVIEIIIIYNSSSLLNKYYKNDRKEKGRMFMFWSKIITKVKLLGNMISHLNRK